MRCCNLTKPLTRPSAPPPVNERYAGLLSLRAWASLAVVAALLVAVPCLAEERTGVAAGQTASVSIDNSIFTPSEITVAPGTTVTWTNNDAMPHTVVDVKNSFRSKIIAKDVQFSFTFTNAGDYNYFCSVHPNMKGKVIVKPDAG